MAAAHGAIFEKQTSLFLPGIVGCTRAGIVLQVQIRFTFAFGRCCKLKEIFQGTFFVSLCDP